VPTPRTGGVAIVIGAATAAIAAGVLRDAILTRIALGVLAMAALGLVDDARSLRPGLKFFFQVATAVAILFPLHPDPLLGLLGLFWIVGVTNAFNFMDGINGIASLEAIICGATMGVLLLRASDVPGAACCFAVAGAAAGFFPWNAFTGSIFMGDTGALALGVFFGAMVVRGGAPRWLLALPLLPFLIDSGITLVRRLLRRERIYEAHRTHFYQRLTNRGWSHLAVTLLWGAFAAAASLIALFWK
jgi:UDP-N-acetylmuramyl pentapeptide phosphotransferase/UDP-N-acetylglucosamine-1-phosphate transferase